MTSRTSDLLFTISLKASKRSVWAFCSLKYPILNLIRTIDENFDVNLCINGLKDIVNLLGENENMKSKGIYFIYNNDLK